MEIGKDRLNYLLNETISKRVGGTKSLKCLWLMSFVIEYNNLKSKQQQTTVFINI